MISFLSFTVSSANLDHVTNNGINLYYSDYIVPGEELEWNVVTFVKEADFNWTIKGDQLVEEGDSIKFLIKNDPDELALTDVEALQYTGLAWADFYLNDIYLGDNSSLHDYYIDGFDEMEDYDWGYLLPPERDTGTGKTNYFEDIYDEMQPDCFNNESGLLEVILTNDLFHLNWESYIEEPIPTAAGTVEIDRRVEISYNLEWGYLDRMKIYESSITDDEQEILELVLENSRSTQTTPLEWVAGLVALFTIGIIAIYVRRRE